MHDDANDIEIPGTERTDNKFEYQENSFKVVRFERINYEYFDESYPIANGKNFIVPKLANDKLFDNNWNHYFT